MNNYLDAFKNAFLGTVDWTWKSIILKYLITPITFGA